MQCFKCLNKYTDLEAYFQHITEKHELRGKGLYRCMLCSEVFNELGRYKKHVRICLTKNPVQGDSPHQNEYLEAYNDCKMENADVVNFKDAARKSSLKFALKLNANMNTARSVVHETMSHVQTDVIDTIIDGIKTVVIPRVAPQELSVVNDFIEAVSEILSKVKTEYLFESEFKHELRTADLTPELEISALYGDNSGDEENGNVLMPILFQITKFLEMPGVFEKIRKNHEDLLQQGNLSNVINGTVWKEKLKSYKEDDFVIPYFFYVDAAQLNHPIGPHCKEGNEEFNYYSFPTIPTQYQSRLENIFVASMFPEKYIRRYTLEDIYGNVVEELTKLANDGLVLRINGEETRVFFASALLVGDNKETNTVLSYVRSFTANYYCRFCRLHRKDMRRVTIEDPAFRRNRQNYDEDVTMGDMGQTGVRENSVFNYLPHFHVTDGSIGDLTHNVEEGVCHYHLMEILHYFIYDEQYFTLEELNRRIASFPYGHEKANIPQPISKTQFDNKNKLAMTATEMSNLIQNITFIIGDLVPEDDVIWAFLLTTVKFYDWCYLPSYHHEQLEEWREEIDHMLRSYQNLFDKGLKPVQHMSIHYPDDTKRFGPLRYTRTIRFEGKHRELKAYSKNTNNRINISMSLGKKIQYNFANRLINSKGLNDEISAVYTPGPLTAKVYWSMLEASQNKDMLAQKECLFTKQITVNGMHFERWQFLPDFHGEENRAHEIIDFIIAFPHEISDIFAVCKTYRKITQNEHFCSYSVDKTSLQTNYILVNIENFLTTHHYPVEVHNINGEFLFRCKRF